jgi:phosphopantothenoylcysteine decarboxylase/phosphopantothenate--cysteine ligase
VHDNLWDKEVELSMGHIELAKWADAILIAPTSANALPISDIICAF